MQGHPGRKLGQLQFGKLLAKSWEKSATAGNAMAGFRATGIFPWNPDCIPDHAYTVSKHRNKGRHENTPKSKEHLKYKLYSKER